MRADRCRMSWPRCCVLLLAVQLGQAMGSFVIEDDAFGGDHSNDELVRLKVLRNTVTGERLEVSWNVGGRTEALMLMSKSGKLRNVLLDSGRNASDVYANTGWKGDMLIPYANRIRNGTYDLNGRTYYLERNEDRGVYGKGGLHGYLYRKQLRVLNANASNTSAVLQLAYDFDGSDPGYPFKLGVVLTYILNSGGVTFRTEARNDAKDGEPIPFMNSWHSYFLVSSVSDAVVELDRCTGWNHIDVTNNSNKLSDLIPTGLTTSFVGLNGSMPIGGTHEEPTYWDDEFKAVSTVETCPTLEVRVTDREAAETSVLWMGPEYRWVQLFTGAPMAFGSASQAVAVEAMSGEADAWNNMQGVRLLQAGETFFGEFGVYLEPYKLLRRPVTAMYV